MAFKVRNRRSCAGRDIDPFTDIILFVEGLRYVGSGRGKVFTAWIGKIAPTVEKESLREILECCGSIRVFRPYIDSTKGFCFVTFYNAQGAMLAELLLQGLVVDGQTLLVRFNKVCCSMLRRRVRYGSTCK